LLLNSDNRKLIERIKKELQGGQKIFHIAPEACNPVGDVMQKAHSRGVSTFIEFAQINGIPLVILPVACEQRLVSRGEERDRDYYGIALGDPIKAADLPTIYGSKDVSRSVVDSIMSQIAGLLPESKRGYYSIIKSKDPAQILPKITP
jgi:hypothetical protein